MKCLARPGVRCGCDACVRADSDDEVAVTPALRGAAVLVCEAWMRTQSGVPLGEFVVSLVEREK